MFQNSRDVGKKNNMMQKKIFKKVNADFCFLRRRVVMPDLAIHKTQVRFVQNLLENEVPMGPAVPRSLALSTPTNRPI